MSLLIDLPDILEVVSLDVDWLAIWDLLSEQLSYCREYRLGTEIERSVDGQMSDERLVAWLYHRAFSLQTYEQGHQARIGVCTSLSSNGGPEVFFELVNSLIAADRQYVAEAVGLLTAARDDQTIVHYYRGKLGPLIGHQDLAVSGGCKTSTLVG